MSRSTSQLLALTCEAPALQLSQDALLAQALIMDPPPTDDAARRLALFYQRTGIVTRGLAAHASAATAADALGAMTSTTNAACGATTAQRMLDYAPRALALATRASKGALQELETRHAELLPGFTRTDITHFVSATCTGFGAPGWEATLPAALLLRPGVHRTHLGFMGCHAAINALRVADAIATSDANARVLVCCTEVCSLHYQFDCHDAAHADQAIANALFADGAAACIVSQPASPDHAPHPPQSTAAVIGRIASSASMIFPQTHDHMGWRIGDHGFQMSLSPQLPDVVQQHAGPWLAQWLAREGLALHDVQGWAVHPGGPSILTACERALGLGSYSLVASRAVLAKHGNMSSPTVLFVLEELLRTRQQLPIVLLSFGPGVAAEAMLLR